MAYVHASFQLRISTQYEIFSSFILKQHERELMKTESAFYISLSLSFFVFIYIMACGFSTFSLFLFLAVFLLEFHPAPPPFSLFSLPSQSLPGRYQSPGQRPRVPDFISTPMPKTLGPFPALGPLPGQPGRDPEVSIYLRHKIIDNYMTRNANNNTSHLLGTSQT